MPNRFDIEVPHTYTTAQGQQKTDYTNGGRAWASDDQDRIDIHVHPMLTITSGALVLPGRPGRGKPRDPIPDTLTDDRYNVLVYREYESGGETKRHWTSVGVLLRARNGNGFRLRLNDGVSLLNRAWAFPANAKDQDIPATGAPEEPFDDDLPPAEPGPTF